MRRARDNGHAFAQSDARPQRVPWYAPDPSSRSIGLPLMIAQSLATRRILLVIGGGIAAYKALDLIRRLRERGASRCAP